MWLNPHALSFRKSPHPTAQVSLNLILAHNLSLIVQVIVVCNGSVWEGGEGLVLPPPPQPHPKWFKVQLQYMYANCH